ncbi:unnamed protein product [Fraxinus pennsylvanica]|uniref:RNase H type-1 domain-containing protein n=1 Tax=Fraxinus pennsylvanica TaxID=56036 RepID=A0AAD1YPR7_9LAMI|nr:unnamed protein product [Fraxinus pennsylvanica]
MYPVSFSLKQESVVLRLTGLLKILAFAIPLESRRMALLEGPMATWQRGLVKERLDHGLCNMDWRTQFPNTIVQHLLRIASDHRPLLSEVSFYSTLYSEDNSMAPNYPIAGFLPDEVLDNLNLCCLPRDELEDDIRIWNLAGNDQFSLASAYLALLDLGFSNDQGYWDLVWQWQGPQRIRAFLWLCMHNKLLTNYDRNRRHLTDDPSYPICHNGVETISHVLRDCLIAKALWLKLLPLSDNAGFFDLNFNDWMVGNLRNGSTTREILIGGCSLGLPVVDACVAAFDALATVGEVNAVRREALISWTRPPYGFVVLNTDGAFRRNSLSATAGGVFRSHNGIWLGGFSIKLGHCNAFRAELWGIYTGLQEAWKNGWRKVQVQVDNSAVALIFNSNSLMSIQNGDLISRVRMLLHQDWQVQILLVYREANSIADHMANLAFDREDRFIWYDDPPSSASLLLFGDIVGVAHPRMIRL